MSTSLLPPAVLNFRVETTASVDAFEAVLAEVARDQSRPPGIRHIKIDRRVRVLLSQGDLVLEAGGIPDQIKVRAVLALDAWEGHTALTGKIFRPGRDAVLALLGGCVLFLVWESLSGIPIALLPLPILAWIAIVSTRISGFNRGRAELLVQTLTHIARLAEALPHAPANSVQPSLRRSLRERSKAESWFRRVGGGATVVGALSWGYLALASLRVLPAQDVKDGFARIGGGLLFGGLMGRAWHASRSWTFLGRWTAVVRGVVAGGTSAWLLVDLGVPFGQLQSW